MRKLLAIFSLALCFAFVPFNASADRISPSDVPADALWIIHLDIAKMSKTSFKDFFMEAVPKGVRRGVRMVEGIGKFDFFNDLTGVTLVGVDGDDEPAVVIRGTLDTEYLIELVMDENPREIPHDGHTIYHWDDEEFGVIDGANRVILAENLETIKAVLDADKKSKSIAAPPVMALIQDIPPESFLYAAAPRISEIADDDDDGPSMILKKTKAAMFLAMEKNNILTLRTVLETDTPESAASLRKMVEGLLAFAEMHFHEKEMGLEIMKKLKIGVTDRKLMIEFSGAPEELVKLLSGKLY